MVTLNGVLRYIKDCSKPLLLRISTSKDFLPVPKTTLDYISESIPINRASSTVFARFCSIRRLAIGLKAPSDWLLD